MELKRILAKDLRRATEKAVALYGQDVLFVSNSRANGMIEVIVAVDVNPEPWVEASSRSDGERFGEVLHQSFKALDKGATASPADDSSIKQDASQYAHNDRHQEHDGDSSNASQHREYIRGREIVDMVRDELSAIRKEFKLAQRVATWQSESSANSAVRPLIAALITDCP